MLQYKQSEIESANVLINNFVVSVVVFESTVRVFKLYFEPGF